MDTFDHDSAVRDLRDPDPSKRQLALMQLEDLANEQSVPPLIAVLSDSDPVVRRLAIALLEELGDPRAVPGIISSLLDSDPAVRDAASAADPVPCRPRWACRSRSRRPARA